MSTTSSAANVKLREAARRGLPVSRFAPGSNGSNDYGSLALEVRASEALDSAGIADDVEVALVSPPRPVAAHHATQVGPREVVVRFRDAAAHDVRIAGDFNGWVPDKNVRSLVQAEGVERVWTKILHLPPGTYHYRYVVDGEWREDPENP